MVFAVVGKNMGRLKKTVVVMVKITTMMLAVHPTIEGAAKARFGGKYLGLRLRRRSKATGMTKDISCSTIDELMRALKANRRGQCQRQWSLWV